MLKGAGKTTIISMLTGLYKSDNGDAWVGGYSINKQIDKVHLLIRVLP